MRLLCPVMNTPGPEQPGGALHFEPTPAGFQRAGGSRCNPTEKIKPNDSALLSREGKLSKEKVMGAMKENPRYNVVSIRVSDDELEVLQEVSKATCKSISEIMREAMSLLQTHGGAPGLRCQLSQ